MAIHVIDKPKVAIVPDLLTRFRNQFDERGQVILHFIYEVKDAMGSAIRIWPTSYLFDQGSTHRSDLVHIENISLYPEWTQCWAFSKNQFTLIFSGLPKSCTSFDFVELCNGSGGEFVVTGIKRNSSDVYYLRLA